MVEWNNPNLNSDDVAELIKAFEQGQYDQAREKYHDVLHSVARKIQRRNTVIQVLAIALFLSVSFAIVGWTRDIEPRPETVPAMMGALNWQNLDLRAKVNGQELALRHCDEQLTDYRAEIQCFTYGECSSDGTITLK